MSSSRRTLDWPAFLGEALPGCLTEVGIAEGERQVIIGDIERRALDYAASGKAARRLLRAPFLDDVAQFLPDEAPIGSKADTAVVVRNSVLETAHSRGPVDGGMLARITYLATGALNRWLNHNADQDEAAPPAGVFSSVVESRRACAAFRAMALAAGSGGRKAIRGPSVGHAPPRLSDVEHGATPPAELDDDVAWLGRQVRCGLDPVDDDLLQMLGSIETGASEILVTSSLSRYNRGSTRLARVLEFVLGHGGAVLTTNFLIRPREVFARRAPFLGANSEEPLAQLSTDRLSGLHARYVRDVLEQLGSAGDR
ncbi:hypothetical protein ACLFMI_25935 [Pseudonocardia nantongensis]|uniref:hypothetical protein n=1 Tax=Pseudonocardia nantongensis TaxID=1181885 RepID=UPI003978CBD6